MIAKFKIQIKIFGQKKAKMPEQNIEHCIGQEVQLVKPSLWNKLESWNPFTKSHPLLQPLQDTNFTFTPQMQLHWSN